MGVVDSDRIAFKKGGAALVDLPHGLSGAGRLVWFLEPRILRALATVSEPRVSAPHDDTSSEVA